MTSLCGEPPGPDGISLKIQGDTRYMTETVRSLERRLKCQAFTTAFLSVLCIILIAIVAWLGVSVRDNKMNVDNLQAAAVLGSLASGPPSTDVAALMAMIRQLNTSTVSSDPKSLATQLKQLNSTIKPTPVYLAKGKPVISGYTAFGSLSRGSGNWAVQPETTPWGSLSDHLVLSNETNLLMNGTNEMIILGGMDDMSVFSKQMWSYEAVYEQYTRMPDMPVPRTRFAGIIGNGKLYVTGGYAGPNAVNDFQASVPPYEVQDNTLDVYTFATGSWARNVTTSSVTRCDHCAMWANGKMYVVGGFDTSYNTLDTVEVFDPATGRFTVNPAMKLPAPRGDVGCNAVGSVLYVHGGYYDPTGVFAGGNHHNTTFAYDLSNPAAGWVRKADMNWARGDHAFSVLSGGRLLVAGGESNPFTTDNKTPIRGVEIYDPVEDVWSEKAPLVYARFRFSAGVVSSPTTGDSTVYAFGGHQLCMKSTTDLSTVTTLEQYQAATTCASDASDTLSVFSNLQHPDVFVYLQN